MMVNLVIGKSESRGFKSTSLNNTLGYMKVCNMKVQCILDFLHAYKYFYMLKNLVTVNV